MPTFNLSPFDTAQLAGLGISPEEVKLQIDLLQANKRVIEIIRPCTLGDGIQTFATLKKDELLLLTHEALRQGRLTHFVPASGAATRMFAELILAAADPHHLTKELLSNKYKSVLVFIERLKEFAFYEELCKVLDQLVGCDLNEFNAEQIFEQDLARTIIQALLEDHGLGYRNKPKAFIQFHKYPKTKDRKAHSRNPLEEQISTILQITEEVLEDSVTTNGANSRLHFSISAEHTSEFQARIQQAHDRFPRIKRSALRINYSFQKSSTNTVSLALHEDGTPAGLARTSDGKVLLRPGGHGALLINLQDLAWAGADLVYVNNIDNVLPETKREVFIESEKLLLGRYLQVEQLAHRTLERLEGSSTDRELDELREQLAKNLGPQITDKFWDTDRPTKAMLLKRTLDRPIRIVGVVKNQGEAGGGPYWVKDKERGESLQIVEKDELPIDSKPEGTHFNPVRLVLGLRNYKGQAFDLQQYVNHHAVFTAEKPHNSKKIRVLERPGLWNGSMSRWITLMVEVPTESFAPVKGVNDLLRDEHKV